MADPTNSKDLLSMTTEIVASHVRNNSVPQGELAELIRTVHAALSEVSTGNSHEKPNPAIAVRRSVTPEYIVCLEDGKKLKMLKRHLKTAYNMTPEEYRERWSLPADYPMVAPNYARQRSALAKKIGLGRRPGRG
jgi:predicted transcriptional regulator